ncbi:FAD-binding oxidoreductase [Catellatospora sp. NPDC049111]|uniref:NAD(P)/FAD-dependent oxidoreductase n=1 Tax=Catellatospora sp. NPDC049111 TaxID=3155271 RepID=UPI0033FCF971
MTVLADAVVVGGGVNGACAAFHLACRGVGRVVLFDTPRAHAATPRSAAVLACHYTGAADAALAVAGLRELKRVPELTGGTTGFRATGVVQVVSQRHAERLRALVAGQQRDGLPFTVLDAAGLAGFFPDGDFGDVGAAVHEPEAGYADPALTTRAYLDAAVRAGARVERTAVRRILRRGGAVAGVETDGGAVHAPVVVLAAGAWSICLLAGLGVDLGLSVRRVQTCDFDAVPAEYDDRPVLLDQVHGSWLRPAGPGTALAGLEMSVAVADPSTPDTGVEPWYAEVCRQRLTTRFGRLRAAGPRGGQSGLITMSPDGRPIVDVLPEARGLFHVVGDSGTAFKYAPVVGRCLAEWIVDGAARSADLSSFGRDRAGLPAAESGYGRFAVSARLARDVHRLQPTASQVREADRS